MKGKPSHILPHMVIFTILLMFQGPSRMRRRLIRNDDFYLNYPYQKQTADKTDPEASGDNRPHKYKRPSSWDSKPWFEQYGRRPRAMLDSLGIKEHQRMVEDLKGHFFSEDSRSLKRIIVFT